LTKTARSGPEAPGQKEKPVQEPADYGVEPAVKIRESAEDFRKISTFGKFVLDEGCRCAAAEELRNGYDHQWKGWFLKSRKPSILRSPENCQEYSK